MKKQKMIALALTTALIGLVPAVGLGGEDSGKRGKHQGPPPEAIKACEGKQVGDEVGFTGRRGETLEASCQERDGQLVAMPSSMPERSRH